jgi:cytochrome c5
MSDHPQESHEAHTGPIKTPKQLLVTVFFSFVIPVFIIIGLVYYVTGHNLPEAGATSTAAEINARIRPVAEVQVRDANRELKTGEQVFKAQCSACHATGAAGSPKFEDAKAWAPRIAKGYEALLNSALHGKGAMGAQGGGDFDDVEVGRGVVYMANAAGAKFAVPQAAAAAPAQN